MNKRKLILIILIGIIIVVISTIIEIRGRNNKNTLEDEMDMPTVQLLLYFGKKNSMELGKEYRYVSMEDIRNDMVGTIINELIKGPVNDELNKTIPEGTKVNSINIKDNTVILDLSKEFEENHNGNTVAEAITIYSIVNSVTEVTEINSVKFLIDGVEKEKYKNNFAFNIAFYRTME